MRRASIVAAVGFVLTNGLVSVGTAQVAPSEQPRAYTYRETEGQALQAFVFTPPRDPGQAKPNAILLFHGGGWSAGAPDWTFDAAGRFAHAGLVAIAVEYSPAEHVRASTPPTSIVHGDKDTLTPLAGARRYCARLTALGGLCELNVYPGVGHLLTRNLANQESDFDPDPSARADGIAQHLRFLRKLGFISSP